MKREELIDHREEEKLKALDAKGEISCPHTDCVYIQENGLCDFIRFGRQEAEFAGDEFAMLCFNYKQRQKEEGKN